MANSQTHNRSMIIPYLQRNVFYWVLGSVAILLFLPVLEREPSPSPSPITIQAERSYSATITQPDKPAEVPVQIYSINACDELITTLKKHELWDIDLSTPFSPILFTQFPNGLDQLTTDLKKRTFLHTLLPVAIYALAEVQQERNKLTEIIGRLPQNISPVSLAATTEAFQILSPEEQAFTKKLTSKYRTTKIPELLKRVDTLPVSLVLAQGAIESSWGTSRFALEGNNIFGIWTWSDKGMIPLRRDKGMTHRVAVYQSLIDSMRTYLLTLNRHPAYTQLRNNRTQSHDPFLIANGLESYSARGLQYIEDIVRVIQSNRLTFYDQLLASTEFPNQLASL